MAWAVFINHDKLVDEQKNKSRTGTLSLTNKTFQLLQAST